MTPTPPISGTQLKKLTRKLRDGTETPDDLDLVNDVLMHYADILAGAYRDVEQLCLALPYVKPMAPRVKTLKTT